MRLLIVGTLEGYISAAGKIAKARGAKVSFCETLEDTLEALRTGQGADLLMVDVKQDVDALCRQLKAERIHVPVVACGVGTDARAAVQAIRAGAREYVPLPPDAELIAAVLEAIAQESHAIVGQDPAVKTVLKLADQVAPSDASVLITGESGTGKELMARYLHRKSKRASQPFISVNCAAIPEHLLESELFGHEKGAFTGAVTARQGRFELAEGGTLFLDEIGDMPLPMQVKLLRVLQERTFERVGSNRSIQCDVRIIAATHRDLEMAIDEGSFREDLYYRICVFPIEVPPLRQRRGDLPLLISELTNRMEGEGRGSVRLGHSALRALAVYHWPGNVRELANLIERLAIMFPGETVEASDLPAKFRTEGDAPADELDASLIDSAVGLGVPLPEAGIDLKEYLSDLEMGLIRQALDEASGVVAHAAKLLGMRRTTLVEKMRKFGISRPEDATEI